MEVAVDVVEPAEAMELHLETIIINSLESQDSLLHKMQCHK